MRADAASMIPSRPQGHHPEAALASGPPPPHDSGRSPASSSSGSSSGCGAAPLPSGWDVGKDYDGKVYYIDHINKKTTWVDPRER